MKAAFINQVGPPENIRYEDLPMPEIAAGQALVQVSAVCVDPVDVYIRSGQVPMEAPRPFILGRDMTGVVERVGSAVTRFAPGDRVWCDNQGFAGRQGTFAEYLAIDEHWLYPTPPEADERQLVAFAHAGLTASIGLQRAGLAAGESIFVQSGSGNVGSAIVQLAIERGARVFATAGSSAGIDWLRSLDVGGTANYQTDATPAAMAFCPRGFDVYWDTSGRHDFEQAARLLAPRGRIVVMAGLAARPAIPIAEFIGKDASLFGFAVTYCDAADYDAAASQINALAASGRLRVRIDRVLPLAAAREAHTLVEQGAKLAGKIVLTP